MGNNPTRDQFRPIFGRAFDEISSAPDWADLTDDQRADRLRQAMRAEDEKYRRPNRFETDFNFRDVVRSLSLPDVPGR